MTRPAHAGLGHLALNAHHLEAMTRFYVDLLGFRIVWQPDPDNVYLSSGRDNLALHRDARSAEASRDVEPASTATRADESGERRRGALDHLGLVVDAPDDVDRWAAFLEAHGVALAAAPRTHRDGSRSLYVDDPDGNRVQIIHLGAPPTAP
jgi:catechol 2,3-dioxygenase-like lactoylglutathione lyase family enzyme